MSDVTPTAERNQLIDKMHCMCGSTIDHSPYEGHMAVSVYDYALDQERARAEVAEARLAEAERVLQRIADEFKQPGHLAGHYARAFFTKGAQTDD